MGFMDFGFGDFGVTSPTEIAAYQPIPLSLPEIPSYNLVPSSNYGGINLQAAINAPDTSGVFGGLSDWFGSAASSTVSGASGAVSSIGNWFSTPSNSNQSNLQKAAGSTAAGSSILSTVSSWFKGGATDPNKNNTTRASGQDQTGLGILGALKALAGVGPQPAGSTNVSQAVGSGLNNILSPLKSTLFIMLAVLIAAWFVMGRLQRV